MINKFLYPNGGSETYLFNLGKALTLQGHAVEYFGMEHEGRCVGNRVGAYTADMEFHSGNALSKLTYSVKTIYSMEARRKIRLVLDDFKPDVCHLNNFNYQLTPSIILEIRDWERKTGHPVRIIYTAHDYQLICPNHMLYNPMQHTLCERCAKGRFLSCLKGRCIHGSGAKSLIGTVEGSYWKRRQTYREINTIVCPSRFMKSKLDLCPELRGRNIVLHNFIDFSAQPDEQVTLGKYVLYFGRLSEEKGIKTLLSVCRALPNIQFVIAGSGPLESAVREVPNVRFAGFVHGDTLYSMIRDARFTVYPSEWYENCPYSVMESQMLGVPVLASRIGGIPELVQNCASGELFTAGDAADFEKHLVDMWSDQNKVLQYREGCKAIHFDTSAQYCEKITAVYQGKEI